MAEVKGVFQGPNQGLAHVIILLHALLQRAFEEKELSHFTSVEYDPNQNIYLMSRFDIHS